jgi:hypothetical protein
MMKLGTSGIALAAILFLSASLAIAQGANRIEGRVYDTSHTPVEGVRVELRNDMDSTVGSVRSDSSGRFMFAGMPNGRYIIRAMPFGKNLKDQETEIQVGSFSPRGAGDVAYADVILSPLKEETSAPPEAVFVQAIPPAAKKLYDDGIQVIKKDRAAGLEKLEAALTAFPNYFDALSRIGKEYVLAGEFEKGYPYLLRAIDVNQRSYSCFYRLGYAFYQLKQYPAAAKALEAAVILAPNSVDGLVLLGTLLRLNENYPMAEKSLLKANTVSDGKNSEAHWQLALLYNRMSRNQDTIKELETYLKLEPNSKDKPKIKAMLEKLKAGDSKSR